MSPSEPRDAVDRLLAGHLERQALQTDATALVERLRRSRQSDDAAAAPPPASLAPSTTSDAHRVPVAPLSGRSGWSASAWTWPVLAAAALLVAFLGGRHLGPATAGAATVLRELQTVHSSEVDRSYQVHYAPDPRFWDGSNPLEGPSHSILWTRGDRFWAECSIGDLQLVMGREEDGHLWISPSRSKGIRFPGDESQLPQEVALLCAVNSMTVPRLVDEVLADFQLRADHTTGDADRPTTVIWARLKPGHSHPVISTALLEVDPESQTLMRLVLWLKREGRPRGSVTYTFLERAVQDDRLYQLRAHLDDDAEIEHHRWQTEGEAG
jgi:hypothetical protein